MDHFLPKSSFSFSFWFWLFFLREPKEGGETPNETQEEARSKRRGRRRQLREGRRHKEAESNVALQQQSLIQANMATIKGKWVTLGEVREA